MFSCLLCIFCSFQKYTTYQTTTYQCLMLLKEKKLQFNKFFRPIRTSPFLFLYIFFFCSCICILRFYTKTQCFVLFEQSNFLFRKLNNFSYIFSSFVLFKNVPFFAANCIHRFGYERKKGKKKTKRFYTVVLNRK